MNWTAVTETGRFRIQSRFRYELEHAVKLHKNLDHLE